MAAREVARGGLLAATAVALLYVGGIAPYIAPACCIAAGVTVALPLLRRAQLRTAVLCYAAAVVLGALVAPRKSLVVAYALLTGLYPILKYLIEGRVPRPAQLAVKLVYANLLLAVVGTLVARGLFPQVVLPGFAKLAVLWFAAGVGFIIYDVAMSRLIALLRASLPPE
ncbi:MAG: hypothetical protein Q4D31_03040 [Eubacteriales bacterium]|nr:hypothetical protein [Eubacteriales bacterium]